MNEQNKVKVEGEALQERGLKLKACNDRCYARMAEINRIASETLVKTTHSSYTSGQCGEDYRTFGKAMCEIRKLVKDSIADVAPDYEMLARQFARPCFDADKMAKAIEAVASEQPVDNPTFYTPDWLCDLAKKLEAQSNNPNNRTILPGCPSLGPKVFPSGADGTAPAEDEQQHRMTVVRPQLLSDIGMVMDKRVTTDENGIVTHIRYAGIRHVASNRQAQLWEINVAKCDDGSHIT